MSLTKASYSMITGAPVNVMDFGAVADGTTNSTAAVQAAMNSLSGKGGTVVIPRGVVYTIASLTWVNFVDLLDDTSPEGPATILNGGNVSGAVNEYKLLSGFHPSYILNVHNDWTLGTLGIGQTYSNRASWIWEVNGNSIWQIANDINATKTNDLTFYQLGPSSFQHMTFTPDYKNIYGQTTSGNSFTGDYQHNFRGANFGFENSSGTITIVIRQTDGSRAKYINLDTSNNLNIENTAATKNIFSLNDAGKLNLTNGVSGGAFTTTNRNAIAVTSGDVGLMVFDTTLGKPVWLKNSTGPVWVDATGTTV
jgi:hypothetical protein